MSEVEPDVHQPDNDATTRKSLRKTSAGIDWCGIDDTGNGIEEELARRPGLHT